MMYFNNTEDSGEKIVDLRPVNKKKRLVLIAVSETIVWKPYNDLDVLIELV